MVYGGYNMHVLKSVPDFLGDEYAHYRDSSDNWVLL